MCDHYVATRYLKTKMTDSRTKYLDGDIKTHNRDSAHVGQLRIPRDLTVSSVADTRAVHTNNRSWKTSIGRGGDANRQETSSSIRVTNAVTVQIEVDR